MSDNLSPIIALSGVALASFLGAAQMAPLLDDPEGTKKNLIAMGYKPVEVGGGVWFGGSEGEFWRTKFKAYNPDGKLVEGYATSGIFKGSTLRDVVPVNE